MCNYCVTGAVCAPCEKSLLDNPNTVFNNVVRAGSVLRNRGMGRADIAALDNDLATGSGIHLNLCVLKVAIAHTGTDFNPVECACIDVRCNVNSVVSIAD